MTAAVQRALRPLAAVLILGSIVLSGPVAPADAAYRAFGTPRFSTSESGDIIMAANTLLTCPASADCTSTQNGTGAARHNGQFNMVRVDVDDSLGLDPLGSTNISSAADLLLPAGAEVRFARLYWGALSTNAANRPNVQFATPVSGGYLPLTATQIDDDGGGANYQSSVDVTALVQAGGAGQYVVGGIEAGIGAGYHAGWSLVVVYGDSNEPFRNLSVFDGFQRVVPGGAINVTVNGFLSPPTGPVTAQIGFVTYEGDDGIAGDFAQLNGQLLNDSVNPATNFFNSRISDNAVLATAKNPNYVDQLGFDSTIINTVGIVPAGATSATITLDSGGDWYWPGVVTSTIDIYVPNLVLDLAKTVTDDNGGNVNPGDVLTYDIAFSNQGDDAGLGVVLSDPIPANTTYLPGSLELISGETPGVKTDATGDDTAYFDVAGDQLVFNLGTTATPTSGGRVAPFASTGINYHARFKVTVDAGTEGLDAINQGFLDYMGETVPDSYTSPTDEVISPIVALADLKLTSKTDSVDPVLAGDSLAWTINARNDGPSAAEDVLITDTLAAGLTFDLAGSDSRCSLAGSTVSCDLGTLASAATDSVVIAVDVSPTMTGGTFTNTAQVSTSTTDSTTADDLATEQTTVDRLVDLQVIKTATPDPVVPTDRGVAGGQVDYLLTLTNNGPATATNVQLTDLLPAGATVSSTSSTGSCSEVSGTITCSWPSLTSGSSVTLAVTLDLDAGLADPTVLTNSASAVSDEIEDPAGQPESDSVDTTIVRSADVSLSKSTTDSPIAGSDLTWDLVATNAGPSHAHNVTLVDTLPSGVTFVPSLSSSTCSELGGVVTCSVPQIDSGSSLALAIGVQLDATLADGAALTNNASVSADEIDPVSSNDDASDTITVSRRADLSILKSGPGTVAAGAQITYTLDIANNGPSVATNVEITDTLPPQVTFSSAPGCSGTATVTCNLATLAVGATASFTIVVDVPGAVADGFDLVNSSSISGDETDPNTANNSSQLTTTTDRTTQLEVTKAESALTPDPVLAGTEVSWDIEVTNLSGSADTNITITDDLTGQPVIGPVTATLTGAVGTCSVTGLSASCSVPSLAGSATALVVLTATADPAAITGEVITNSASASGDFSSLATGTEQTTILGESDLTLTKTGPSDLAAGETGVWTIEVENSGPADATDVEIADLLPVGVSFVSSSTVPAGVTCTPVGANVECIVGTLAAGATATVNLTALVDRTTATGIIANAASSDASTTDPDPSSNSGSVPTSVTRSADIDLSKVATTPSTTAGDTVSFALTATNAGPSLGTGVVITDTIPTGFTLNTSLSDASCSGASTTVTCNIGDLDPLAAPVTVNLTFDVDPAQAQGLYTNSAVVSATEPDPVLVNNDDSADFTVDSSADLAISKGSPASPAVPGATYTYTIDVINNGPSIALSNSVTDTLPSGTTLAAGTTAGCIEASAGTVTCALADLAPAGTASVTIVVAVDSDLTGSLSNTASVSGASSDPEPTNNSSTDVTPLVGSADLELTKTTTATVDGGDTTTWTIDVSNNGPSDATSPVVTDSLPPEATFSALSNPLCTAAGSDVTCTLADLAPGETASLDIVATVSVSAVEGSLLTNDASITSAVTDPSTINNTDTASARVTRSADISLTKVAAAGPAVAGGTVTYEITASNNGPSTASSVFITDIFVPELTPLTAVPTSVGSCSVSGQTVTCSASDLLPGETIQATVEAQIDSGANVGDTIANTASVTANEPDPTSTNNSSTEVITVTRLADLSVAKLALNPSVVAGQLAVWEVEATNNGPSAATQVVVSDALPSTLSFDAAGSSAGCSASGSLVTCTTTELASGASEVFTVSTNIDPSAPAGSTIVNTATGSSDESDPDSLNDDDSDSVVVTTQTDLTLTKSSPSSPPVPGTNVQWPISIVNNGPSDAVLLVVTDTLPPGTTFTSATSSSGCSLVSPGIVECTIASLDAGGNTTVTVGADVAASRIGDLTNSASVTSATNEAVTINNDGSTTDALVQSSDLTVTKTAVNDPVVAGQISEWLVEVTNNGPSYASGVTISDTLGSDLTYVDGSSDSRCDLAGPDIECSIGSLAAGATESVTISATLGTGVFDGATINNSAVVASSSDDPDSSNNATGATAIATRQADLAVTKTSATVSTHAGAVAVWNLVVVNNGPSDATGIVVSDTLPAGATFDAATSTAGCAETTGIVTCSTADLVNGSGANLTIGMTLPSSLADGTNVSNTASVTGADPDPVAANDTSTDSVAITQEVDLAVTKNGPAVAPVPGQVTSWVIDVVNTGPSDASAIVVTDTLPASATFDVAGSDPSCSETTPGTISCSITTIAAGATGSITVAALVPAGATADLTNSASATSAEPEPNLANNSDDVTTSVDPEADLTISKTLDTSPIVAGAPISWTLEVTNNGPSDALDVLLTDTPGASQTFVAGSSDVRCTNAAELRCDAGTIAAGTSEQFIVTFDTDPSIVAGTPLSNTVNVISSTPDPTPNTAAAAGLATTSADVSLAKFALTPNVLAGEAATWQLSVNNPGPSVARDVLVSDPVPTGATFDAAASDSACVLNGSTVECSYAELAPGTTTTADIVFSIDSAVADSEVVTNNASVTATTPDPASANNSASSNITVTRSADVRIVKTHSGPAVPGELTTWTLVLTNFGPSQATGITVADTLPAEATYDAAGSDPGCSEPTPGVLSCSVADIASGSSTTVSVSATLDPDTMGSVTNSASVAITEADPDGANNSDSSTVDTAAAADLGLTKSLVSASPLPGQPVEFLISVTNLGPSNAADIEVADTFGSELSFNSASDSRCTNASLGLVTCAIASLASGSTADFTVFFDSDAAIVDGATVTNAAAVTSATNDPVAANNSDNAQATFVRSSDLAVAKTGPSTAIAGEPISYDLTLTNNGPSDAGNASLTDTLPAELTATGIAGDPSCVLAANTVTCSPGTLEPGDAISVVVSAVANSATADGAVASNTAVGSSDSADPAAGNDSATVLTTVTREVDLVLSKTLLGAIVAGREVLWELSLTNAGPSDASSVTISDSLPTGLTFRDDLSSAGCVAGVTCSIPSLPAGQTATVIVGADADPGLGLGTSVSNTATVTSPELDVDPSTNTDSDSGSVVLETDVSVLKQGPAAPITAGTPFLWTLDVANAGPSNGTGLVVTDTLPAGTSLDPATADPRCAAVGLTVTCVIGDLSVGNTDSLDIGVNVGSGVADGLQITNNATITADQGDPSAANNSSSHVVDILRTSGLTITKTDLVDPVVAGEQLTWTVTVANPSGPSDTANVLVVDTLPAGIGFDPSSSDPACVEGPVGTVTCSAGTVAAGASRSFTIVGDVAASISEGVLLRNDVTASGDGTASVTTSEETTVTREIDLSVDKRTTATEVVPGVPLTYEIEVTNAGPSDATGVSIVDALPPGAAVNSVTPGNPDCTSTPGSVTCQISSIAAGSTTLVTIEVTPEPWLPNGSNFDNTVAVSANEPEADSSNDDAISSVPVVRNVDVSLTKIPTSSTADAGDTVVYTIEVNNAGPSDATDAVVIDVLPAGVTYNAGMSSPGCVATGQTITCEVPSVPAGASTSLTLAADVDPATTGIVSNTAAVTTSETNANSNTTDTADITIAELADLTLVKTAATSVVAGEVLSFTLEVTNNGPGVARNVVISDTLGSELSFNAAPGNCSATAEVVTCDLGDLAVGETSVVIVETLVDPSTQQPISNTATVSSDAAEVTASDNVASSTSAVTRTADVVISKSAVTLDTVAGGQVSWLIEIVNQGPSSATAPTIVDVLPPDLEFIGELSSPGCIDTNATVSCTIEDLAPGQAASITLVTQVSESTVGVITNTASAQSSEADPNPATAVAQAAVEVRRPNAQLSVTKSGSKSPLKAEDVVTWTITVSNTGPEPILGPITISDVLPAGHNFHSIIPSSPDCQLDDRTINCEFIGLPSGESVEVRLKTKVQNDQKLSVNTVLVTATGVQGGSGADATVVATATAQVQAAPALAFTGSSLQILLFTALGLFLAGLFFLFLGKRREDEELPTTAG